MVATTNASLFAYVADGELDEDEAAALARAVQNPVASLISLPFQNNTNFGIGPDDKTQNVMNIQPVWPFDISTDWKLITRTIIPIVSQPGIGPVSSDSGLGDTLFTAWLSPLSSGKTVWGVGPVLLIPTSTGDTLGAGEWGLGVSAVGVYISKPWVVGAVVNNVWSVEGAVNSFTFQYFVNYNLDQGWYVTSAPILTANWEAASGQQWTIPFGAGIGRVFRIGKMPVNTSLHYYYNVERPTGGPEWQLRFQVQLLFPK